MTKRETKALTSKLDKLEKKLAKKRDEIRAILQDYEGIVESFSDASDSMDSVVMGLRRAREELTYATNRMSEFV